MAQFILLSSIFVFLLAFPSPSAADLATACKDVHYGPGAPTIEFCVNSLQAVPGAETADTASLAVMAANLAITKATSTEKKITQLEMNADPAQKKALKDCEDEYGSALEQAKTAIDAVKKNKINDANIMISASMSSVESCGEGFGEVGSTSPIAKENDDLDKLLAVSLYFVARIGKA